MKKYLLIIILLFSTPLFSNETTTKVKVPNIEGINVLRINSGDLVYAGTWGSGIQTSSDAAASFQPRNNGLNNMFINAIDFDSEDNVYIGTQGDGVYKSTNDGNLWVKLPFNVNNNVTAVYVSPYDDNEVYIGTYGSGVFVSYDGGETWKELNRSLDNNGLNISIESYHVTAIALTIDTTLLVGTYGDGVYRSEDKGDNWRRANSGTNGTKFINEIEVISKDRILMATNDKGLMESNNDALQWTKYQPAADSLTDDAITCVEFTSEGAVVGTREIGAWYYNAIPYAQWIPSSLRQYGIVDMATFSNGDMICFEYSRGLFKSTNKGAEWKYLSLNQTSITKALASDGTNFYLYSNNKLRKSTDNGETWSEVSSYTGNEIKRLKYQSGYLIAITKSTVWLSSDKGNTWKAESPGDGDDTVEDAALSQSGVLYTCLIFFQDGEPPTFRRELHKSTNYGTNWERILNFEEESIPGSLVTTDDQNNVYYYRADNQSNRTISKSTNQGTSFANTGYTTNKAVEKIEFKYGKLFLATRGGFHVSSDRGATFDSIPIPIKSLPLGFFQPNDEIASFAINSQNEYFVGFLSHQGVYHTTNAGIEWDSLQTGFYTSKIQDMAVNNDGDLLIAGGLVDKYLNKYQMGIPQLNTPEDNALNVPLEELTFDWEESEKADLYEFQISADKNFSYSYEDIIKSETEYELFYKLGSNTKYYWRVRGKTGGVYSTWSQVYNFTTLIGGPDLISPAKDTISVNLLAKFDWHSVEGAEKYRLYISTDSLMENVVLQKDGITDTTYTLTEQEMLMPLTHYYWAVAVEGADGSEGKLSEIWKFRTILGSPTLISPENNSLNLPEDIVYKWEAVTESDDYQIQVSRFSDFSFITFDAVTGNATEQPFTDLEFNVNYYWRVRAIDTNDAKGAWSEIWTFRTGQRRPVHLSPANNSGSQPSDLTLDWTDVANYKYKLQLSDDANFDNLIINTDNLESSEYELTDLAKNKTYYWRVQAVLNDTLSPWTEAWNFSTGLARTALISPENGATDMSQISILFKWGATEGADSYQLQVSNNDSFTNIFFDESDIKTTSKDVYDFVYEQQYYWRVKAFQDGSGNDWSEVRTFTVEAETVGNVLEASESGINIYPNPAKESITINIPSELVLSLNKITIISQTGQIMQEQEVRNATERMDINNMDNGTYYIIMEGINNRYLFKLNKVK